MIFRLLRLVFFGFFLQIFGSLIVGAFILYYVFGGSAGINSTASYWWNKVTTAKVQVNIEKDGKTSQYNVLNAQK